MVSESQFRNGKVLGDSRIKQIIETFRACRNVSETARTCQVSWNTAKKYCWKSEAKKKIPNWRQKLDKEKLVHFFCIKYPLKSNKSCLEYVNLRISKPTSISSIFRIKMVLNIKRKRINNIAFQRSSKRILKLRNTFCKFMAENFQKEEIIWIDEVHIRSRDCNPTYGF